jgi:phosphatidylserine/phosphatidylglycerophosphate/cardiolipin synthase-like enzyme
VRERWSWQQALLSACWLLVPVMAGASQEFLAQGTIEVAFEPQDDAQAVIIRLIDEARHSIRMQAYILTSQPIAKALVAAQQRGVEVAVLVDAKMNKRGSGKAIPLLQQAGVPVAYETEYAAAHNKVIVVDEGRPGCAVLTGSYNFTWSASQRNAENVLIVRGQCELVRAYADNWRRHFADAQNDKRLPFKP